MTRLNRFAAKTLAPLAAGGLIFSGVAPANAMMSDNSHNIAGGGVNIHADNTCVEKIGDTAHVKFEVQHQPLVTSSDGGVTSADGYIALPKNLKNVKIGIKAVADNVETVDKEDVDSARGGYYADPRKAEVFDTPIDMPIVDRENSSGPVPLLGGSPYIGKDSTKPEDIQTPGYEDRGFSKKVEENPKDPNKVDVHFLPTEQELRDHIKKFDVHMRKVNPVPEDDPNYDEVKNYYIGPFMQGSGDGMWYGNNIADYDIYEFGSVFKPTSFEIEADVDVEHDDTFVTAATSNLGWKSVQATNMGSYEEGSQSLQEYPWFRPGLLPPAIPSDPDMIQKYKEKLSDAGLDISPTIAPTGEMSGKLKYIYIGNDIRPSAREDVGASSNRIFTLRSNPAVTYTGQVPQSGEDGADITAAHVTLCPAEETPDTDVPETDVPETETPETDTPETETPETETPETDTPETETPDTETPETETPETETPETETPETETPETETPETETPNTDTPETETPETDTPNTDTPETETPETETPETETPNTDIPETDNPNTDTPETDVPETETPNTDTPETETPVEEAPESETPQRTLATTGASVIGITVGALVLLAGGIFLARRKKQ